MRYLIALTLTALLTCSTGASAQTAAPPTVAPPAAAPPAASAPAAQNLTPAQQANRDRIKSERETCRTQAQGQGLKGPAVHSAVLECMSKVDPKAAKRMGCFQAAKAKSLVGDEMKKSVKDCMQGV